MTETQHQPTTNDPTKWTDEEWHQWRHAGITASFIAAAYTDTYGGIYGKIAKRLNLIDDTLQYPELAERGHRWEQPLLDTAAILHGYNIAGSQQCVEHPDIPEHRATLDACFTRTEGEITFDDVEVICEAKTVNLFAEPKTKYWEAQGQWQLHCTGKDKCLIVVATIDDADDTPEDPRVLHIQYVWVERDDWMIGEMVELAGKMLGYIEREELPTPGVSAMEAVGAMSVSRYDKDAPVLRLTDEDVRLAVARDEARQELAVVEKEAKELKATIAEAEVHLRNLIGGGKKGETAEDADPFVRVTVSKPKAVFTDESFEAWQLANPDKVPLVAVPSKTKAKQLFPDDYEEFKQDAGKRSIYVKVENK